MSAPMTERDPLERFKEWARGPHHPEIAAAIAAWEKERAEHALLLEEADLFDQRGTKIDALRVALERIEEDIRNGRSGYLGNEWRIADALRALRLGETVDSGGPAAPHVSDRREERGTAPEASGQGAPRVEDSHAKLAADMRASAAHWGGALPRADAFGVEWAARVEALGRAEEKKADSKCNLCDGPIPCAEHPKGGWWRVPRESASKKEDA